METEEQERNRKQRKDLYGIMETGNRKDGIERHPTAYFGDPGAIVHFIEQFHPEYETCLLESLKRTPTVTTIWMLNRCMNAGECLNEGPGLLQEIANRADVDKSIREQAREYIGGQQ